MNQNLIGKLFLPVLFIAGIQSVDAQFKTNEAKEFNSKKERLIEKEIIEIGNFKDLSFQKIIMKDLTEEASTLNLLGIMSFHETFNSISKRTITLEKEDLVKLIDAAEQIEKKSNAKPKNEVKYKYLTQSGIEIGSYYNPTSQIWGNYLDLSSRISHLGIIKFSRNELIELIQLLKSAESQL